ncbi:sensor domain-containing protein [Mycolicibacterium palauense]|uniref:sensor domain-containing protein n=1 Tax=Mycolicibacterium palauense TaxID=2034511 RepID=UPI001C3F4BCF|nr:sensor domain-containing protein [Mycolicibacterium palauense]
MTYEPYGQGPGDPRYPQYPDGPPETGPPFAYGPGPGGPQAPYGPPGQPGPFPPGAWAGPPQPPERTNPLATLSVVFAFVFAPVGAVLGHLALSQIRQRFQPGRDRAIIGLTLSYTFIMLAVFALALWGITATSPSTSTVAVPGTSLAPGAGPAPSVQVRPPQAAGPDLSAVLLNPQEIRAIMGNPKLRSAEEGSGGGDAASDAKAEPAECAGTVIAGLATEYTDAESFRKLNLSDPDSAMLVDQFAARFAGSTDARDFVSRVTKTWRGCAGEKLTLSASGLTSLTWRVGTPVQKQNVTTLVNTFLGAKPLPYYRILAAKSNVVIDLSVFALKIDDEPATIAEEMLSRIPG